VKNIKSLSSKRGTRQAAAYPQFPRKYVRTATEKVIRDRRRSAVEFGDDPLEKRATSLSVLPLATLPERIVFKKLSQMLRSNSKFLFQRIEKGGRNLIGGFIIDFLIVDREPAIALEILGDYWHQAYEKMSDLERELAVKREGYFYHEIWEHDIYQSDELLEQLLFEILGDRIVST